MMSAMNAAAVGLLRTCLYHVTSKMPDDPEQINVCVVSAIVTVLFIQNLHKQTLSRETSGSEDALPCFNSFWKA